MPGRRWHGQPPFWRVYTCVFFLCACVWVRAIDCEGVNTSAVDKWQALAAAVAAGKTCINVTDTILNCTFTISILPGASVKIFASWRGAVLDGGNTFNSAGESNSDGHRLFQSMGSLHLENLTLTRANQGVYIKEGAFTAKNVVFAHNHVDPRRNHGGGLYFRNSGGNQINAVMEDCVFIGNIAGSYRKPIGGWWQGSGGAVAVNFRESSGGDSVVFRRCTFERNFAGYIGGAVYVRHPWGALVFPPVEFWECTFPPRSNSVGYDLGSPDLGTFTLGRVSLYGTSIPPGNSFNFSKCGSSCANSSDTSQGCTALPDPKYPKPCFSCLPCSHCSAGHYRTNFNSSFNMKHDCTVCPAGHVQPSSSMASCLPCPVGKYVEDDGIVWQSHIKCEDCPAGISGPIGSRCCDGHGVLGNANSCEPCPHGTFGNNSRCIVCAAGWYADTQGMTACKPCPAGTALLDNGENRLEHATRLLCKPCSMGRSSASSGAASCAMCQAGQFSQGLGNTACYNCPEGFFSDGINDFSGNLSGDSKCTACPEGTSSEEGALACSRCNIGKYSDQGDECVIDIFVVSYISIAFCLQSVAAYSVFWSFRRRIEIEDISYIGTGVVVTTVKNHHVRILFGGSVQIWGSGLHKSLWNRVYRIKVIDPKRFSLLSSKGEPVTSSMMESSQCMLMQSFPHEFVNQDCLGLLGLGVLPIPWLLLFVNLHFRSHPDTMHVFFLIVGIGSTFMALMATVVIRFWNSFRPTYWGVRLAKFRHDVLANNPNAGKRRQDLTADRGAFRGIRLVHVVEFLDAFRDKIMERSAYYLVPNIIMPLTEPFGISYAELVGSQCLHFFVSHYWGTAFRHFVAALQHHGKTLNNALSKSPSYWVCFFSNNQWAVDDELGHGDWKQSSFYLALSHSACRGTCMVLDEMALPLTRSWCLFEVLTTYKHVRSDSSNFAGLQYCTDRGVMGILSESDTCYDIAIQLSRKLSTLTIANATATDKQDEKMIRELVELEGGTERMDSFVRENMLSALKTIQAQFCGEVQDYERNLHPSEMSSGTRGDNPNDMSSGTKCDNMISL